MNARQQSLFDWADRADAKGRRDKITAELLDELRIAGRRGMIAAALRERISAAQTWDREPTTEEVLEALDRLVARETVSPPVEGWYRLAGVVP